MRILRRISIFTMHWKEVDEEKVNKLSPSTSYEYEYSLPGEAESSVMEKGGDIPWENVSYIDYSPTSLGFPVSLSFKKSSSLEDLYYVDLEELLLKKGICSFFRTLLVFLS